MRPTRLVTYDDAPLLATLERVNREFLAPWSRLRDDDFYTEEGQRAEIRESLDRHEQGSALPHVILDEHDAVVGRITLNGIVRGPFLSCSVGYWVNATDNGRGLASAAVADLKRVAFEDLGLHRIQAETMLNNEASQRVLHRNGFVRIGLAPNYLNIAGRWQDHYLFQVVNPST